MKKTLLLSSLLAAMLTLNAAPDDKTVLLTIEDEPAYVSDFLYIYSKNSSDTIVDQKSLDEYLEMYINYKLKVYEAKQLGLDTARSFVQELQGYRRQMTPSYLTDTVKKEQLLKMMYERKKEDVAVSHIAVQCPMNASAEDTLAAYNKIAKARQRITEGIEVKKGRKTIKKQPEDFKVVAQEVSNDPSVKDNGGYLGWIVPFRYVPTLEDAAYNTPVGQVSKIFRTPFGYHILKVEQRIPHVEVKAAHIMKMTPRGTSQEEIDSINLAAQNAINQVYSQLMSAENTMSFEQLAKEQSDDRGSSINGGNLNWFGRGMMVPEFEQQVFAMTDSGQISKPVKSQYGWHIIMLTGKRNLQPYKNVKAELERNLMRDERSKLIEQSFVDKQKRKYHFVEHLEQLLPFYDLAQQHQIADSAFYQLTSQLNGILITFGDQKRTQADFAEFLKANSQSNFGTAGDIINDKYKAFVNKELTAYADSQLENEYVDFRNLMSEYHDGILLFNLSLDKVWNRATTDTVGLRAYFAQHKKEYKFAEPKFKGRVVYCKDLETMKAAKAIVKNANPDSVASYLNTRLNSDSIKSVKTEKGVWAKGHNGAVDKYGFKDKNVQYSNEEFPYVFVVGKIIKAAEEYTDVRGDVTSAYQDYLEKQWVKELRAKYKVVVDEKVFDEIKQNQK